MPDKPLDDQVDLARGAVVSIDPARLSTRSIAPQLTAAVFLLTLGVPALGVIVGLPLMDGRLDQISLVALLIAAGFVGLAVWLLIRVHSARRLQRVGLKRMLNRPAPVPVDEAAIAAFWKGFTTVPHDRWFHTELYLEGAGAAAPRVILLGVDVPAVPPPQAPGEAVELPQVRFGIWNWALIPCAVFGFNSLILVRDFTSGADLSRQLLSAASLGVFAVMAVVCVRMYLRRKQPRFVIPGALTNDAAGEQVFRRMDRCVLVLRRPRLALPGVLADVHAIGLSDATFYFADRARLIDFVGRWLLDDRLRREREPTPVGSGESRDPHGGGTGTPG